MTHTQQTIPHRIAAVFLAAALLLAALIVPAGAASSDNTFTFSQGSIAASGTGGGYQIDGTDLKITTSGTYTIQGTCTEGSVTVKKELTGVTLIFSGLTLSSSKTAPLTISKSAEVTLQVTGTNTVTDNEDPAQESTNTSFEGAGIKVKTGGKLELAGSGTLTVGGKCKNGIKGAAEAAITVNGPTLHVTAENDALSSDGAVTVKSGTLNLTAGNDGIQASPDADDTISTGTVTLQGGTVSMVAGGDGIGAKGDVNITGGTYTIQTGGGHKATLAEDASAKGIKSAAQVNLTGGTYTLDTADDAIHADGNTTVAGGSYTISAGDDGLHADSILNVGIQKGSGPSITISSSREGFEAETINLYAGSGSITSSDDGINASASGLENGGTPAIHVYGGTWKINASGDGVDSNGDIHLYGGLIEVFGASGAGDSAFDYDGTASYEGGTLFAVGMSGMAQAPSSGTYVAFGGLSMMGGGRGGQGGMPPKTDANGTQLPPEGKDAANGQRPAGQRPTGTPPGENGAMPGGPQNANSSSFSISAGSRIVIKNSAGTTVYAATGLKAANCVVFADQSLVAGETYTLYLDGTEAETATAGSSTGTSGENAGGKAAGSGFPFRDIAASSWYSSAVRTVYQEGIMKGTSSTSFAPEESMTRAMLAQILYQLAGSPAVDADTSFTDVSTDAWYANAVHWTAQNNLVSGYGDGQFGPDDAVTREQMATLLYRYAQYRGYDISQTADLSAYGDSGKVSPYAQSAVHWANAAGLMTGTEQKLLLPLGNATRAEAASILMRFGKAF